MRFRVKGYERRLQDQRIGGRVCMAGALLAEVGKRRRRDGVDRGAFDELQRYSRAVAPPLSPVTVSPGGTRIIVRAVLSAAAPEFIQPPLA